MAIENIIESKQVVHISTDVSGPCKECGTRVGGEEFAEAVNHYIGAHHYRLLHVGSQSSVDQDGKPFQMTVAVLGK
jgi:hypothetical protein